MTAILRVLRNVQMYFAMSKIKIYPYDLSIDSIAQCPNVLRNVHVYCAMFKVKVNPCDHFVTHLKVPFRQCSSDLNYLNSEQQENDHTNLPTGGA